MYGDEPHAFSKKSSLPIRNLDAGEEEDVFVELTISTDNGLKIIFKRIYGKLFDNELEVSIKDSLGETNFYRDDEADYHVDGFVPAAIREFFFFDGEQLDTYFKTNRTKNIENRIFILSHIDILDQMIERLGEKYREYNRQAGKLNKDVEPKRIELEKKENALNKEINREKSIKSSIAYANDRIKQLDAELKGIPDVIELEKRRDELKEKIRIAEENFNETQLKINELLLTTAPSVFAYDALFGTLKDIKNKDSEGQLPPEIDKEVVESSLNDGLCKLCDRSLDDESREHLIKVLSEYNLSSKQSRLLLDLKSPIKSNINKINNYLKIRKDLNEISDNYKNSLEEYTEELNFVKGKYAGYESDSIKLNFQERENLEKTRDNNNIALGAAQKNIENLEKQIEKIKNEIDDILSNNKKTKILNNKKQLCSDSLELLSKTKNDIMVSTKVQIADYTKEKFFKLIWKKDTFKDINIDEDYNVELIHSKTNTNCLGSASAAERELLALAFTLGVHSVSGFNSPLLIDTPLARVAGSNRLNFTNVLLEISKNKQTILILTPDEFSQEVRDLIYNENIQKFGIVQQTEYHSEIEEMSSNRMEKFIEEIRGKNNVSG